MTKPLKGMIALTKNERFVQDAYRRFLQLFGKIGLGIEPDPATKEDKFDKIFEEVKEKHHATWTPSSRRRPWRRSWRNLRI
jgi:hypothetical protein